MGKTSPKEKKTKPIYLPRSTTHAKNKKFQVEAWREVSNDGKWYESGLENQQG